MPFNIYVIELDEAIWGARKKFREANPHYNGKKPCVYVGMTSLTPQERFEQHKNGVHSARFVRQFGVRLRPRLFEYHNPLDSKDEAAYWEQEKARRLRNRGYAVWQN